MLSFESGLLSNKPFLNSTKNNGQLMGNYIRRVDCDIEDPIIIDIVFCFSSYNSRGDMKTNKFDPSVTL